MHGACDFKQADWRRDGKLVLASRPSQLQAIRDEGHHRIDGGPSKEVHDVRIPHSLLTLESTALSLADQPPVSDLARLQVSRPAQIIHSRRHQDPPSSPVGSSLPLSSPPQVSSRARLQRQARPSYRALLLQFLQSSSVLQQARLLESLGTRGVGCLACWRGCAGR